MKALNKNELIRYIKYACGIFDAYKGRHAARLNAA